MLEFWGMRSTLSLSLLPDPQMNYDKIELFEIELFHLAVCKQMTDI